MKQNVCQINGGVMINIDVNVKKYHICGKNNVSNPAAWKCEN